MYVNMFFCFKINLLFVFIFIPNIRRCNLENETPKNWIYVGSVSEKKNIYPKYM